LKIVRTGTGTCPVKKFWNLRKRVEREKGIAERKKKKNKGVKL